MLSLITSRKKEKHKHKYVNPKFIPHSGRKKLRMMVVQISKDGCIRNSKCCDNCLLVMKSFGIKTVWYSNEYQELVKQKIGSIDPYIKVK